MFASRRGYERVGHFGQGVCPKGAVGVPAAIRERI